MSEHLLKTIEQVSGTIARLQDLLSRLHEYQREFGDKTTPAVPRGTTSVGPSRAGSPSTSPGGAAGATERNLPTVPDLVAEAARRLTEKTPLAVFDQRTLVNVASELHPTRHTQIKNGIYNAVHLLKKRGVLKLAPGGFQLVPNKQEEWEKLRAGMELKSEPTEQ